MKTFLFSLTILAVALGLASFQSNPTDMNDLDKLWQTVSEHESRYQWKSAQKIVNQIQELAKKQNRPAHLIKANIFLLKYDALLEESLKDMDAQYQGYLKLAKNESNPAYKAVYHAYIADWLSEYYTSNQYEFSGRTEANLESFNPTIATTGQMFREIQNHYMKAVEEPSFRMLTDEDWLILCTEGQGPKLVETIWEVTCKDALTFFMKRGRFLEFEKLEEAEKLVELPTHAFVKETFDKNSDQGYLLCLIQDILDAKSQDDNSLCYFDHIRHEFLIQQSGLINEDEKKETIWRSFWETYQNTAARKQAAWYYLQTIGHQTILQRQDFIESLQLNKEKPDYWESQILNYQLNVITLEEAQLKIEKTQLPDKPMLAMVAHKNLSKVSYSVYSLPDIEAVRNYSYKQEEAGKLLYTKEINLPKYTDYETHQTEVLLEALPAGNYIITMGDSQEHIFVSNHKSLTYSFEEQETITLMHALSGKRMRNQAVTIYTFPWNRKDKVDSYSVRLDEKGLARVQPKKSGTLWLGFEEAGQSIFLPIQVPRSYPSYDNVKVFVEWFTDRQVYRPGQAIHFKGLLKQAKNAESLPEIMKGEKIAVQLMDANYQVVGNMDLITNEFGSVEGIFQIPTGGLNGYFQLNSEHGSKSILIEEYKRPKFDVKIKESDDLFTLNEKVELEGEAMAYAGFPIQGGKVKYTVTRRVNYYRRFWFWPAPSEPPVVIKNGTTLTDADGNFALDFIAKVSATVDLSKAPRFSYEIQGSVTDANGETHDFNHIIWIGVNKFMASTSLEQVYHENDLDSIPFSITNNQSQPVDQTGKITIDLVEMPVGAMRQMPWHSADTQLFTKETLHTHYPYLPYGKTPELSEWKTIRQVFSKQVNGKQKSIAAPNLEPGVYRIRITVDDSDTQNEQLFFVWNDKSVPTSLPANLYVSKKTFEPGENIQMSLLGVPDSEPVFFEDFMREDATIPAVEFNKRGIFSHTKTLLEKNRGGGMHHIVGYNQGKLFSLNQSYAIPYSNKKLQLKLETFRDKVKPGAKESYTIQVLNAKGESVVAELLATMYDASLDAIESHKYSLNYGPTYYNSFRFNALPSYLLQLYQHERKSFFEVESFSLPTLISMYVTGRNPNIVMRAFEARSQAMPVMEAADFEGEMAQGNVENKALTPMEDSTSQEQEKPESKDKVRENLNEMVFFFPNLKTDEKGKVSFDFDMNEALTKWKLMVFAHTQDLEQAYLEKTLVTQKELMVVPELPRTLRAGDTILLKSKIVNLTEEPQAITVRMELNAITGESLNFIAGEKEWKMRLEPKGAKVAQWKVEIPHDYLNPIEVTVFASSPQHSDGEKKILPVLTNKLLVHESLPFYVNGGTEKLISWNRLEELSKSQTLQPQSFTFQVTENPAWDAVTALPYMAEYPYECSEQIYSRIFGFAMGQFIGKQYPEIAAAIRKWEIASPEAFMSALEKNQELKNVVLEATPWVLEAQDETDQKRKVKLLFDSSHSNNKLIAALGKLQRLQRPDGGFAWFEGGNPNWYITQYITLGLLKLQKLGALSGYDVADRIIERGAQFCQNEFLDYYNTTTKTKGEYHVSPIILQYLYLHGMYPFLDKGNYKIAVTTYLEALKEEWPEFKQISQFALAGKIFQAQNLTKYESEVAKTLVESAVDSDEMGMYWKNTATYFWYGRPVESQVEAIEFFHERGEKETVNKLKQWLIANKRTNHWNTTTSTASAVYALIAYGSDYFEAKPLQYTFKEDDLGLKIAFEQAKSTKEPFAGRFSAKISPKDLGDLALEIKNPNAVQSYGGLHLSYMEEMDKITSYTETPLKLEKDLYVKKEQSLLPLDSEKLEIGEQLIARLILEVDRPMEFVHIKDYRASGLEPVSTRSGYRFDGGLGYYENIKDASVDLFFDYLPRGRYVLEYPLRAANAGDFSNGMTSVQCMYAPEFSSHTKGRRISIEE